LSTAINEFDASVVTGNDSVSVTMDVYYVVDRNEQNNRLVEIEGYVGNIAASQADNGSNRIEFSYNHEQITQVESWNGSEWQATTDVTPAGEEAFRTAAFDIQSLEDAIPLRLNVDGSWREALLLFNRSNDTTALRQVVQDAVQQHAGMVAGSYYGEYLQTNKDRLMTAVATARTNGTYLHSQYEIDTALAALQSERELAANSVRVALRSMPIAADNDFDRILLISGTEWLFTFSVVTENDQKYVSMRARNYGTRLNNLQYQDHGEWKPAEFVSAGSTYSTMRIPFHVAANNAADLSSQVVSMRASLDGTPIDFRLLLHTSLDRTALDAAVQSATTAHSAAVVGTATGQYPQSAKTALQTAITAAKTKGGWLSSQSNVNEAVSELNQAITTFQAAIIGNGGNNGGGGNQPDNGGELADGYYTINYSILQDTKDEISMADGYVVSPALLHVQGTSRTIQFVVKQSEQINYFTINGSSENVVSRNADKNTRIVSFTLPSLDDTYNGTVSIHWPEFNYNNKLYDIRFSFNENSIVPVSGTPEVPGKDVNGNVGVTDGKVEEHNGTNPGDDDGKEGEGDEEGEEGNEEGEEGNEPGGNDGTAPKFSDTSKHWAADTIGQAVKLGIVSGYDDGSFRPDNIVTRAEFAVMLGKALQLEGEADLSVFSDEANIPAWAKKYVALVTAAGAIGGFEDGTFRSDGQLSRAQLAVIVARAAGLKLDPNDALDFADANQIPAWARQEVAAAVKAGLVKGMDGNLFEPSATATRAQALTIIMRLLETL
jgi:heme-binding NEAT domain protein